MKTQSARLLFGTINIICRLALSIECAGEALLMETLDICIATYRLMRGNGIDVSVCQFARELAKSHNVTLAVTGSDMGLDGMEALKYRIGFGDGLLSAAKDLDKRRFDLISTHYPPFDLVASLMHAPHYLHDPGIPSLETFRSPKDMLFWSKVNSSRLISGRNVRCVLPASNYLGREFRRKYFYRGPMEVLPYGIDFPDYSKRDVPFSKYILYVGRHTPYKGVHTLMEIFKEVKEQVPDAGLVTIGNADDGYGERLAALASGIGGVHMLGYVPDVWPYYQNASVYATCSSWEGEDRPVIEAQYMGKPAVAFNNCSHPEVVEYGALAADKKAFKEALVKYLSGDYTSSSVSGRIGVRFSVETMARRFIEIVRRHEGAGE